MNISNLTQLSLICLKKLLFLDFFFVNEIKKERKNNCLIKTTLTCLISMVNDLPYIKA